MKIVHFTSLHNRYDTRVFVKQCCSLSALGHEVILIVADGLGEELINGVNIIDIGHRGGMKMRLRTINPQIFQKALEMNADCYFYHDPELCIQASKLLKQGKRVVYDAHEDSPRQYLANAKGRRWKAQIISKGINYLENKTARNLTGIMTATQEIKDRYSQFNDNVRLVRNYPLIDELSNDSEWSKRIDQACYIGGLRNTRGISEIIEACGKTGLPLKLAGPWQPVSYEQEVSLLAEWKNTTYLGFLNRVEIRELLSKSKIGFLTLYKTPNHLHSLPVKLFEYMLAGIPVIASDIAGWKKIIEKNNCGICVDPHDIKAIEQSILWLIKNPDEARKMGENGRLAVEKYYSWDAEFKEILKFLKK